MTTRYGSAARLVTSRDASWYRAPALSIAPEIVHGVTHADLGNFSKSTGDPASEVEARRERLLAAAGLTEARLIAPSLHHGASVAVVERGEIPPGKFDGLVTRDPSTVLAVTVADCVPVFFVDVEDLAFGVVHAGWRGLAGGIVRNAVDALAEGLGVELPHLLVGTGPAIRGPSYEVGPEVAGLFPEEIAVPSGDPAAGRALLDLPAAALGQASAAGVPPDNLVDFSICTFQHEGDLFSHRRGDPERHWAFIGRA